MDDSEPLASLYAWVVALYARLGADPFSPAKFSTRSIVEQYGLVVMEQDDEDYSDGVAVSGRVGYLDEVVAGGSGDDKGDRRTYGLIYFDVPFCTSHVFVPLRLLLAASRDHVRAWLTTTHEPSRVEKRWRDYDSIIRRSEEDGVPVRIPLPGAYRGEHFIFLDSPHQRRGVRTAPAKEATTKDGWFYCVQLVPDIAPGRVKLGFSTKLPQRLAHYRVSNPNAKLIFHCPCNRSEEKSAIEGIARTTRAKRLSAEVIEVSDASKLEFVIGRFFQRIDE